MEIQYGTPRVHVVIGNQRVDSPTACRVELDRSAPIGRAEISVDREVLGGRVAVGQDVSLAMGFLGSSLFPVLSGKVMDLESGRLLKVVVHDKMRELTEAPVKLALRNVTCQEAVGACMSYLGLQAVMSSTRTTRRHHFIAASIPGLEVLRRAREAWDLDWDAWATEKGEIWFGPWADSPRAKADLQLELEYGRNLLELTPRDASTGTCETFLSPWLRHSHRVSIRDTRLWQRQVTARVERVEHLVEQQRGGRTRIAWTLLD
jgi:hypothetical protein